MKIFALAKIEFLLTKRFPTWSIFQWIFWIFKNSILSGSCCGIIYALMGPISQKHSFLTNIALVITFSISFFRMGIALPIIISGQFCKVGDWSSGFYIFGSFTLAICVLWFIIVFFDFKKRKEITVIIQICRRIFKTSKIFSEIIEKIVESITVNQWRRKDFSKEWAHFCSWEAQA